MNAARCMRRTAAAAAFAVMATHAATATASPPDDEREGIIASFESDRIRLADGWGEAHACFSDDEDTRCYRSEHEMDRAEAIEQSGTDVQSTCSSSLRLYSSTGYGGSVLALSTRYVTISLESYGFNNVTSSYRVGACSSRFYDTNSGGTAYPGNTNAGVSASSMLSGWNNRVGSVYIS